MPQHKLNWRLSFDDHGTVCEQFASTHGRLPNAQDWDDMDEAENIAIHWHARILKEQFDADVVPGTTRPSTGGAIEGECTLDDDALKYILNHEDYVSHTDPAQCHLETSKYRDDRSTPATDEAAAHLGDADYMTFTIEGFTAEMLQGMSARIPLKGGDPWPEPKTSAG